MTEKEILSRRITHPEKTSSEFPQQGIALVVLNSKNQLLLVRQTEDDEKFDRQKGFWNIITETRETGESVKKTVARALQEETGQDLSRFIVLDNTYRETNGSYTDKMGYHFKFRTLVIRFLDHQLVDPNMLFQSFDGEIDDFLWVDWENIDSYCIEEGAKLVLRYYGRKLNFLKM